MTSKSLPMPLYSSSQHSFPNIFRRVIGIETGPSGGTSLAFSASTLTPTQPSGNGSASLNMNESVYKAGMIRPL